jgi:hypothetical protein
MAALALKNSNSALGAYFRRIARRKDAAVAVFATARKLAILIYRMLKYGQDYFDEGAQAYDKRFQQQRLRSITTRTTLTRVPKPTTSDSSNSAFAPSQLALYLWVIN